MVDEATLPEYRERCHGGALRDQRPGRAATEANPRRVHAKPRRGEWMLPHGAKQPLTESHRRAESPVQIHADAATQKATEPREWGLTRPS
jgi:hypothetical protein